MNLQRRHFLQTLLATPLIFSSSLEGAAPWSRYLILIELNGGNDGLNTVVPSADPLYYSMRPRLAISRHQALFLDERFGLHPGLQDVMPLWRDRQMAIVLGVGYPRPNLSHFRSIEIWDTATSSESYADEGWLVRLLNEKRPSDALPAHAVVLGGGDFGPLSGGQARVVALKRLRNLRRRKSGLLLASSRKSNPLLTHVVKVQNHMDLAERRLVAKRLDEITLEGAFPNHNFGTQMATAARLIAGGSGIPIIKCSLGSFDTHAGQASRHQRLLMQLAEGLSSFSQAMKNAGKWNDILLMTYSEFGRRPRENASGGTDHGTAAPHFILGGRVNGGFYGEQPPLDHLDGLNLSHRLDFRALYATAARRWLGLEAPFLGAHTLPIIN